jgi:hypothetical protein
MPLLSGDSPATNEALVIMLGLVPNQPTNLIYRHLWHKLPLPAGQLPTAAQFRQVLSDALNSVQSPVPLQTQNRTVSSFHFVNSFVAPRAVDYYEDIMYNLLMQMLYVIREGRAYGETSAPRRWLMYLNDYLANPHPGGLLHRLFVTAPHLRPGA